MRSSGCLLAVLLCWSTFASADLKIKTRTTMMGHSSESTVYIKGARERNEMSFGGGQGSVSIIQCDQKRMITVAGGQCMVMPMGGGETSCPAMPSMRGLAGAIAGREEPEAPSKGGVITITRNSTDTGERQEMFGFKARHIKSSMTMVPSPDACNQNNMKMEMDGWYADISADFSCAGESYASMACGGGGKRGCRDRIITKGSGGVALGYPLKQTMTMTSGQGTFTMTTEVLELTNTSLEAPLFEPPPGCHLTDMAAAMGGATSPKPAETPAPSAAAPAPQPVAPPAPVVAEKAPGVVRVGVVKIKDNSGEQLPTDNLRLDLLSEISKQRLEPMPLDAEAPHADVESEARAKNCDYIAYTVTAQVKDPNTGGIAPASLPKGVTLDAAKSQALTTLTLYKVGKPQPELKDVPFTGEAPQLGVDAVSASFVDESKRIAQQVADDAHPKPGAKTKPAVRPGAGKAKPKQ